MRNIRLSSLLDDSFRDELERTVFFNHEQSLITGTPPFAGQPCAHGV
jgi:hypothetical protein